MPYFEFIWDEEPGGNVEHIAEHGLSIDDVEEVVFNPTGRDVSRSSGLPIVYGFNVCDHSVAASDVVKCKKRTTATRRASRCSHFMHWSQSFRLPVWVVLTRLRRSDSKVMGLHQYASIVR
jgi:hypothetical protein